MLNKIGLPKYSTPTYSVVAFGIPGSVPPAASSGLPSAGFIENYQDFPLNNTNQRLI